jgi:hypothetical protein
LTLVLLIVVRGAGIRGGQAARVASRFSSGMYGFRTVSATEREPLNYKIAVGKFPKSAQVKFFTKSGTPWLALISRF